MARPTKPKDLKPKAEGEVAPVPDAPAAGKGLPAMDLKLIITLVVVVLVCVLGSAGSTYAIMQFLVMPNMEKAMAKGGAAPGDADSAVEGEEGIGDPAEEQVSQVGMNLELDEFMVNLKPDPAMGGNQYLRAKMALSIQVPEEEDCYAQKHAMAKPVKVMAVHPQFSGGTIMGAAAPVVNQLMVTPATRQAVKVDRELLASGGGSADPHAACEAAFKTNMGKYVPTIRDIINQALMKRTATVLATVEGQEALKEEIKEELSAVMAPHYSVLRVNFQDFIIQR